MSLSSSVPETLVQCHRLVAVSATAGTGRWSVSPNCGEGLVFMWSATPQPQEGEVLQK